MRNENFHAWVADVPGGGVTDFGAWILLAQLARAAGRQVAAEHANVNVARYPDPAHAEPLYYTPLEHVSIEVRERLVEPRIAAEVREIVERVEVRLDALARATLGLTPNVTPGAVRRLRIGRNEPCPCGSEHKFKRCCGGDEP